MACEEDVQESLQRIIEVTPGLVIAGFYVTDCCRLGTFIKATENTERILTISMKQAYPLHRLNQVCTPHIPINSQNMAIYKKQKLKQK
ncbi:MAG: hypothetical protein U9O89_07355 [Thermoproteota archaeon]|nr:hypothetical protein [Thermoproteota archaeon]